jgi:cytochrome c-type biogenesis protein CcmF
MLKQGGLFAPISREGSLVFNNLFLTTACLTVFVGTLYPLALEALTGAKISVGGPFFNLTFGPLFVALMFAMPFGPLLAWKRGDLYGVAQRLMTAFAVGLVAVAAAFAIKGGGSVLAPFGVGLAFYVMMGAIVDLAERTGLMRLPMATVRTRAFGLPRSAWGTAVAHFGIAVSMLGIISAGTWGSELIVAVNAGQKLSLSGYDLTFDGVVERTGPNYNAQVAKFTVREGGVTIGVMEPSKRNFSARATSTNEAALMARGAGQLYLSLGDSNKDGSVAVRLYYKPLVMFIWLGALIMMFGGALSLSDRRLRVGAPKPAAKTVLQPAE